LNEELANGYFSTPTEFVAKAVAKGYKWVAYQWNDGNLGPQQQALATATRQACQGKLIFTVWLTRPFDGATARQAAVESQCQGIILEGEIPSEWINPQTGNVEPKPDAVNWPEVIFQLSDLNIPKAVVSNSAPFVHHDGSPWREKAKPLIDDGWAYISECFITESPGSTPAETDFFATRGLGWPTTQPMIEGWHLADYGDLSQFAGVSHWDAGNVL
jgi:hypothetical protein